MGGDTSAFDLEHGWAMSWNGEIVWRDWSVSSTEMPRRNWSKVTATGSGREFVAGHRCKIPSGHSVQNSMHSVDYPLLTARWKHQSKSSSQSLCWTLRSSISNSVLPPPCCSRKLRKSKGFQRSD